MSSLKVRAGFNAELSALGKPFYDTINRKSDPVDPLWLSAEYYTDYTDDECYSGRKSVETGTVDVSIFTKAGGGDVEALTFADTLIDHFRAWRNGPLCVVGIVPPSEINTGDAESRFYGITVSLEYNFRY